MALQRTAADFNIDSPMAFVLRFPRVCLAILCLIMFSPGINTLPPLDRDESRYTQATKQMIETGDFIEIRFQDEARNKKPVGIYWMQALTAGGLTDAPYTEIWAYRIPSVLGALLAVLLVFGIGRQHFDDRTGLIAAVLMACCLLMVGEAHIAKTDAVQLACIVAAQAMIARFYFYAQEKQPGDPRPSRLWSLALWGAIGVSILVKGPIAPFLCILTIVVLSAWERNWSWIWSMRPIAGLGVIILITIPWLVAINLVTEGKFLTEAWGRDFAGKVVGSQEGHGGYPSYYLWLVSITFWPGSLFLVPAAIYAWMTRNESKTRFLLAWLVPLWLILEFTPTKLPHYVLPLYPALALLSAAAISQAVPGGSGNAFAHWSVKVGAGVWLVLTIVLAGALLIFAPSQYGSGAGFLVTTMLLPVIVAAAIAAYFVVRMDPERAMIAVMASSVVLVVTALAAAVPKLDKLMLSPNAAKLAASVGALANNGERLVISGYTEPSFVFLAGTKARLAPNGAAAADFLIETANAHALVAQKGEDEKFRARLAEKGYSAEALGVTAGVNYSKNRETVLTLYRLRKINQ